MMDAAPAQTLRQDLAAPHGAEPGAEPGGESDPHHAIAALVEQQRADFIRAGFASAEVRIRRLNQAITLLENHREDICSALQQDYGCRPHFQSTVADILVSLDALKYCRKHIRQWMKPQQRGAKFPLNLFGAKAYIHYQPLGVVGIIAPWNFPIQLTFSPLANVLAAGNRALIKPSELTPATSALLATLFARYFDASEVAVVTGGVETASAFSAQKFDHLIFTGAPSVGKFVMQAAARNLVPVTLELGGKCPVIVGEGADIQAVVERVMIFKTLNAGQICLAPDTLFIKAAQLPAFIAGAKDFVRAAFPAIFSNGDYASVVNARHYQRIMHYLDDATARGLELVTLGDAPDFGDSARGKIQPTLVINPPDDAAVMRDEIFGPAMPVRTYQTIDEVVDYVNRNERPLALYYFGNSTREKNLFKYNTVSGGMVINDIASHALQDNMPLGGVGHSGMGSYHGIDGFRQFSHARGIYEQGRFSAAALFKAPYKASTLKLIEKMMG